MDLISGGTPLALALEQKKAQICNPPVLTLGLVEWVGVGQFFTAFLTTRCVGPVLSHFCWLATDSLPIKRCVLFDFLVFNTITHRMSKQG